MTVFTNDDVADPLERPAGKRGIEPSLRTGALRFVNDGEIVPFSPQYLHYNVGGFAYVFRVRDPANGEEIALRCWKRADPPAGARERAEAFDRFVAAHPLPCLLRQQFFPRALFIKEDYRPIIIMPWVNGLPLRDAVSAAVTMEQAASLLAELALAFEQMVLLLQANGVGHGDLQHENIIVRLDGSLCLIDYDSVFVPGMVEGTPSPVGGAPGYGHPDYVSGGVLRPSNAFLDTFSAVVIAASLHILSQSPELFGTNSKDNLLFSNEDISDPGDSVFVRDLQTRFAGTRPIHMLLSALVTMHADRLQAQIAFANIYTPTRKRIMRSPRFSVPVLTAPPTPLSWKQFAPAQFADLDDAPTQMEMFR